MSTAPTPVPTIAPQPDDLIERQPGIHWAVIPLVGATAAYWTFLPDLDLARHNHPHAQLVVVLDGSIDLIFDDHTVTVHASETLPILPYVYHGARVGPDGVRVVDVFVPTRKEYEAEYSAARAARASLG